jgi:hypothetical protein
MYYLYRVSRRQVVFAAPLFPDLRPLFPAARTLPVFTTRFMRFFPFRKRGPSGLVPLAGMFVQAAPVFRPGKTVFFKPFLPQTKSGLFPIKDFQFLPGFPAEKK